MDIEVLLGLLFFLGIPVMAMAGVMVSHVYGQVRRERFRALLFEEKLAGYRHAVDVASRDPQN